MKHAVFFKNAAVLTVTSLILRTIGIFFRIFLSGKIGAEGMGLYQLIVSIYVLGSTFATSGISTAVTRLIADEMVCGTARTVRRILYRAIALSLLIGLLSTAIIFFGADLISTYWIRDVRAAPALRMLAFSLPSMGVSSCLRGYLIARRKASDTSYAQLLEQVVRIGVIVLLIDRFSSAGLASACLAVMIGDTVAEWTSCAFLALRCRLDRRHVITTSTDHSIRATPVVRRLLSIAAPITAGRYLNTALRTVENLLVPNSIARFTGSAERGLAQFGALKGMALPLVFFPASFLSALSTLLIPEISSANALHQHGKINRAIERTLQLTCLSSMLIGAVFFAFSQEIGLLLYNSEDVGLYLAVLAPLTPIMYAESIVDGILKGLGQQVSSLKYSVLDSALRIVLILFLVPRMGMNGFLLIMVLSNLLTSFLNMRRLLKVTTVTWRWGQFVVFPVLSAATAVTVTTLLLRLPIFLNVSSIVSTISGILCMCGLYVSLLFLLGCLRLSELRKTLA
ncbi:MAG: polysaccharide biosynthesis protein [Clostridia bacterium]|nr:polysaccharide biosynthesis protein [Clostridia bacterium]